jgi:hypothetical protein
MTREVVYVVCVFSGAAQGVNQRVGDVRPQIDLMRIDFRERRGRFGFISVTWVIWRSMGVRHR